MGKPWFNHASIKSLLCLPDDSSRPLSRFDVFRLKNWMLIGNYQSPRFGICGPFDGIFNDTWSGCESYR